MNNVIIDRDLLDILTGAAIEALNVRDQEIEELEDENRAHSEEWMAASHEYAELNKAINAARHLLLAAEEAAQ